MKNGLIIQGGWEGHQPELTSQRFARMLLETGEWQVKIEDSLEYLEDENHLSNIDLLIMCWTMGKISDLQRENVSIAVAKGMGLAGCHGGMCDAFREDTQWQFMTGGQWVAHPGGDSVTYTVQINHGSSPILTGLENFIICSEHYYLHVDPAIEVLATTRFPHPDVPYYHISNKFIDMPVAWTKFWGNGRIFYQSIGHQDKVFEESPMAHKLMKQGLLWAGESKSEAIKLGLTTKRFENNAQMY